MSHDINGNEQEIERASKSAFSAAIESIEPPPFLKHRIVQRLILKQKQRRILKFLMPALSIMCAVALTIRFDTTKRISAIAESAGFVNEDYVIHYIFSPKEIGSVGSIELQLPDGVQFRSSRSAINRARKLRLAFQPGQRAMKLPFVIRGLKPERAELKVRIFDRGGNPVENRVMAIRFLSNVKKSAL